MTERPKLRPQPWWSLFKLVLVPSQKPLFSGGRGNTFFNQVAGLPNCCVE